jgi:hypothetical protein
VRSRRRLDGGCRPLKLTVRRRRHHLIRNSTYYAIVFVLTLVAWFYLAPFWSQTFLLGRTFESEWSLVLFWGFDFLAALAGAFALALLVTSNRPLLWAVALGLGFTILKVQFTRQWTSPDADWTIYAERYGFYCVPLLGALAGGLLSHLVRRYRASAPAPNQRLERP